LDLVDGGTSFDGSDGFSEVGNIPDVQLFVTSSSGEVLAVGGDCDGVDRSVVGFEGGSDLEIGVPDFESSIPTGRGEVGLEGGLGLGLKEGTVSHAGYPFGVVVGFRGEFAVSEGVPKFDLFVGTRRDNLSVAGREVTGENFLGVASELFGSFSSSKIPKSESLIPR